MKRSTPSIGSMPIVESSSPRTPEIRPLRRDFEETPAITVRPKIESQKYSGLLNCIASSASTGERK